MQRAARWAATVGALGLGVLGLGVPAAEADRPPTTLTVTPAVQEIGGHLLIEGTGCLPEEDVFWVLGYTPSPSAIGGSTAATSSGSFRVLAPLLDPHGVGPAAGDPFYVAVTCGSPSSPDTYATFEGTIGTPSPGILVTMPAEPISPGEVVQIWGEGCPDGETLALVPDDPAVSALITQWTDGRFSILVTSNPAAPSGSTLTLTVTCGTSGEPSMTWTGTLDYLGDPAQPPVAEQDTVTVPAGQAQIVDVLANDGGPDLVLVRVNPPTHGTAVITPDGAAIEYTPRPWVQR